MRKTKYSVKYTTAFKKDYKRAIKIELLEQVVALLSMGEPLPDKNRDHDLSGDWVGHRNVTSSRTGCSFTVSRMMCWC